MTKQIVSNEPPAPDHVDMALAIECPACDTMRAFKMTDTFNAFGARLSKAIGWEVTCDKCGHLFVVKLFWANKEPGWTARRVEMGQAIEMVDTMGLVPIIERKQENG